MSTEDFQDRASSYRWQREVAFDLIADRGTIVAEFFDVGHSRRKAWVMGVTDLNPTSQAQAEMAALPACAAGSGGSASGVPVIVDMRSANVH